MAVIGPEILVFCAGRQFASARRSCQEMQECGHTGWTLTHAFYADSGGFMLQTNDVPMFPVSAKQIHYLVQKGLLGLPSITREEILDKSDADAISKTIAALQTAWFVTQCIARAITGLPVTPLELGTISILICSATSYFYWWHKPLNVNTPSIIVLSLSTAEILGHPAGTFQDTPLGSIEPNTYTYKIWDPQYLGLFDHGRAKRPLERIPNDRNPRHGQWRLYILTGVVLLLSLIPQFLAWDFSFPTESERTIWHWICIGSQIWFAIHATIEIFGLMKHPERPYIAGHKIKWPLGLFFLIPFSAFFLARIATLVLVGMSMRSLPMGAFMNVEWTTFLPHAG